MSAFQSKSLGPGSSVPSFRPDEEIFVDVVSPHSSSPPPPPLTATYPDDERMPIGAPNLKAKFAAALSLSCDTLVDEDLNNNSCTGSATSLGDCSATPSPIKSPSMAASPSRKASRRGSVDAIAASPANGRFTAEDRHLRRQIANCNERRRMQSINAGFHRLREFLPRRNGEKLSKAAILQQTAELIRALQTENRRLGAGGSVTTTRRSSAEPDERPEAKRRRIANEETDRHSGSPAAAAAALPYLKLIDELRSALEKEQQMRLVFEQELGELRSNISKMPRRPESAAAPQPLLGLPMGILPSALNVPPPNPPANAAILAANLLKSLYAAPAAAPQLMPQFKVPMESMGALGALGPMGGGDRPQKDLGSLLEAIRQLENVNFKPAADILAQMSPKSAASGSDLLVR